MHIFLRGWERKPLVLLNVNSADYRLDIVYIYICSNPASQNMYTEMYQIYVCATLIQQLLLKFTDNISDLWLLLSTYKRLTNSTNCLCRHKYSTSHILWNVAHCVNNCVQLVFVITLLQFQITLVLLVNNHNTSFSPVSSTGWMQ